MRLTADEIQLISRKIVKTLVAAGEARSNRSRRQRAPPAEAHAIADHVVPSLAGLHPDSLVLPAR